MAAINRWIILVVTGCAVVVLVEPSQGRRVRHASWLSAGKSRCARCPPGWGVERRCGAGLDTACTPCRAGQAFSPHHSARAACALCSRCGQGLYAARDCTATRDTLCAACSPPPPPHRRNQDYYRRCVLDQEGLRADDEGMVADAPAETAAPRRHRVEEEGPGQGPALARYGLSQSTLPARSKSDMARSILADPGPPRAASRLPHALLVDDAPQPREEYALHREAHAAQAAHAGPAYSVLTDDGPVAPAAPELHRRAPPSATRPPPPRYPLRLSSPIAWGSPSAPSVNTKQGHRQGPGSSSGRGKLPRGPGPTADLPLALHRRPEDADIDADEVGRLML